MRLKRFFGIPLSLIGILLLTSISFQSCKSDKNDLLTDNWITEKLNDELNISFPETYTGSGRQPNEEGFSFSKERKDNKVVLSISGETFFLNYGETIENPLPDTYGRFDSFKDIIKEQEYLGRFYYLRDNGGSFRQSDGIYFVKRTEIEFSKVIGVSYSQETYNEVIQILENIRKK